MTAPPPFDDKLSLERSTNLHWNDILRRYCLIVLSVSGWITFGAIAVWSVNRQHGLDALFGSSVCIVYVIWQISESHLSKAEIKHTTTPHDKNTTELAAAAKILLMSMALIPLSRIEWPSAIFGLLLLCLGILLRRSAIKALGDSYTNRIRIPQGPLCCTGPYQRIRHPAYLGTLLAHIGVVFVFTNLYSILALVLLWLPAVVGRIYVEENLLTSCTNYNSYMAEVQFRLIKGVW